MKAALFLLLFWHSSLAFAKVNHIYACAFEKPFIFGASISAGYDGPVDVLRANLPSGHQKHFGPRPSPVEYIARRLHKDPTIFNFSEVAANYPFRQYGHRQFQGLPDDVFRVLKKRSTLWASLDAFYWPSIEGKCVEAIHGARQIIQSAKENRKPLLLATIPEEDAESVDWIIQNSFWRPPNPVCVKKLNSVLHRECRAQDQCYVVDLHDTVQRLNSSEGIIFEGQRNFARDFRFDGLHLSNRGNRWIAHLILKAMAYNPPACAKN